MNQEIQQKDQIIVQIHQPKNHPWTEIQMAHEPTTHQKNKEFKEKYNQLIFNIPYLSSCFDETYNLSDQEIKEWWNLRVELYSLQTIINKHFNQNNQPYIHMKMKIVLKGSRKNQNIYEYRIRLQISRENSFNYKFLKLYNLFQLYLLTETELQEIRNQKWTEFGFQQADPTTDFRGGGVQSLDDITNFVSEYKDTLVKEMCKPQNDFYFAASSINVTFFIKRYFHLQEQLDKRDIKEIADRVALKNFCRFLVKEENFWKKLHQLILTDLFNEWVALKKRRPETTIMDYGPVLERIKHKTKRTFSSRLFGNVKQLIEFYQSQ